MNVQPEDTVEVKFRLLDDSLITRPVRDAGSDVNVAGVTERLAREVTAAMIENIPVQESGAHVEKAKESYRLSLQPIISHDEGFVQAVKDLVNGAHKASQRGDEKPLDGVVVDLKEVLSEDTKRTLSIALREHNFAARVGAERMVEQHMRGEADVPSAVTEAAGAAQGADKKIEI